MSDVLLIGSCEPFSGKSALVLGIAKKIISSKKFCRPQFKNVSWPICGFYFVFQIFNIFLINYTDLRPLPGFPHLIAQKAIFAIFPLLAHRARLLK